MDRGKAIPLAVLFAIGIAGLIAGGIGAYLFYATMVGAVILAPFEALPDAQRRLARLAATALAIGAWVAVGALVHDWDGADYAVAGVVGVIALAAAARLPEKKNEAVETPATNAASAPEKAETS